MEYIKSPINYAGSKFRLIKKGLLNYFPDNIDTFVDLFGGAGNVSVNVNANNIIYNDKIPYLPKLFNTWENKSLEEINQHLDIIEIGKIKNDQCYTIEDIFDPFNIEIIASRDKFKDEMIKDKIYELEKQLNELKKELEE